MKNRTLTQDYLFRASKRLCALEVLLREKSYADVVRESQEVVELCLRAVLRHAGIEVPRIHDVSDVLEVERGQLAVSIRSQVDRLRGISRDLRRDRELAFYGTEDLTPSNFYHEADAKQALKKATWVYETCRQIL